MPVVQTVFFRGLRNGNDCSSRNAFGGLFAFYAAKAHHDHNLEGEYRLLKLFGSADHIPDQLLKLWSEKVALLDSETVGRAMEPRAHQIFDGSAHFDHASDFLHVLLKDLAREAL